MNSLPSNRSRAEKRALWEIQRQRRIKQVGLEPSGYKPGRRGQPRPRQRKNSRTKKIVILFIALTLATIGLFAYRIFAAGNQMSVSDQSFLEQMKNLLFTRGQHLKGEKDGRVNILLIGIGGEGHEGPDLADTVMIASIKPETDEVALLSIPRDLYVQVPGENYYTKINAIHAYGESRKANQGPELLREKTEEIIGQPVHYYARIDFLAFKGIIDAVGGVAITTEKGFYDYWHRISFPAGTEKMDGERALAYTRARYIEGSEGGDFKRSARQQQVLLAMRDKVFSVHTALDFSAVNSIVKSLSQNIRTDMQLWEIRRLYELSRTLAPDHVQSVVLSTGAGGVLVGTTEMLGGTPASVLRPRTGDYSEIRSIFADIFSTEMANPLASTLEKIDEERATPEPTVLAEQAVASKPNNAHKATIEVRNGTTVSGLAKRTSDKLKEKEYEVLAVGNAKNQSAKETFVYSPNPSFIDDSRAIAELLNASPATAIPVNENPTKADILIILGSGSR